MRQHVQDRFPDSQEWDRECVNTLAGFHCAGEEHMLLAEVDDGVVLFEKVTLADRLITELAHRGAFESCESDFALIKETSGFFAEENDGRIVDPIFLASDFEMRELGWDILELESGRGNTPDIDAGLNGTADAFGIQVFKDCLVADLLLPAELLRMILPNQAFKKLPWHQGRCVLNFVVRASIVGVGDI